MALATRLHESARQNSSVDPSGTVRSPCVVALRPLGSPEAMVSTICQFLPANFPIGVQIAKTYIDVCKAEQEIAAHGVELAKLLEKDSTSAATYAEDMGKVIQVNLDALTSSGPDLRSLGN